VAKESGIYETGNLIYPSHSIKKPCKIIIYIFAAHLSTPIKIKS